MSKINIRRAIDNIRANTSVYTPVVELIVNAIQAIDERGRPDGVVSVRVQRASQPDLEGGLPDIIGFQVEDNGIGFTDEHRNSFDTLYTDRRMAQGGKGFGRFVCLKYFDQLKIATTYREGSSFIDRSFSMGKENDIIVDEHKAESKHFDSKTVVTMMHPKPGPKYEKRLSTIARNLVERLLPYFIAEDYTCPTITIAESDESEKILLNDYVNNEVSTFIREIPVTSNQFTLDSHEAKEIFSVRVYKIYAPRNQRSRISLVAHKREVSGSVLHKYIPEFENEFSEHSTNIENQQDRNYIVKSYIFGDYLDRNVSLERGGFEFKMDSDIMLGISQRDIEVRSAHIAREAIKDVIESRLKKKERRVQTYVDDNAPWHKTALKTADLSGLPYNPTEEQIEVCLHRAKLVDQIETKKDVQRLLAHNSLRDVKNTVVDIVNKLSVTNKDNLTHYIAHRRTILDLFKKSLEVDQSGNYSSEGVVHDIIFPRGNDSERTSFVDHNLWIFDERLNFTKYVASDISVQGGHSVRPDLLVYDRRVLFRGDNKASNPITVFEFKKPQREDFVNASSREDPIEQVVGYVNRIRDGNFKTPEGRDILITEHTPAYGFVICDLTAKVEEWLLRSKNFKPMPDRLGWFQWRDNINLYIEVVSWDKVSGDAVMRNKIFFKKLGI